MPENFQQLLISIEADKMLGENLSILVALITLIVTGYLFYFVAKGYIMPLAREILAHFKPALAQSIAKPLIKMTDRLALLGPLIYYLTTYHWFVQPELMLFGLINKVFYIYFYINVALLITSSLNIGAIIYNQQEYAKEVPIKGVIQIIKLAIIIVFGVLTVAELIGKTPLYLLSGLGALTAVLLLIFKDTILGLVAGIQIATHRLVAHGDWIEMPQYGADGDVLEVGLHTVKVRNFDKTITTIPTYKLISDSFKNWRGMTKSNGRRIKRALLIDVKSVAFLNDQQVSELLTTLGSPAFSELIDQAKPHYTNIGLFRLYCECHMTSHPMVNQNMTLMARQLAPSEHGIAIELYCFCSDKRWIEYEIAQAELVEHLLACMPLFGIKAYQTR